MSQSSTQFAKGPFATFGCIMMLIGTSIGAAMLALPLSSADTSWPLALAVILIAWLVMTITGLLMLEVNLAFPIHHNHFHSMTEATIGRGGQLLSWICCLGLFYSILSAYISGNASLLTHAISATTGASLPDGVTACLFTIAVAAIIGCGTRSVDLFNRGFMSAKGLLLIIMLSALMPHISPQQLIATPPHSWPKILTALALGAPIFLFGFGYHAILPSLVNYVGPDKSKMRTIILVGTTTALFIYILWLTVAFGVIPSTGAHSFAQLSGDNKHLETFLGDLEYFVNSKVVHFAIDSFANIAMTTSCLGVSLGLFDLLADGLQVKSKTKGRLLTLLLTLGPPLAASLIFPHLFLVGLSIAAIFVIVLEILIPVAMVYRFRKQNKLQSNYKVAGGTTLLIFTAIVGFVFLGCAIAQQLHHSY